MDNQQFIQNWSKNITYSSKIVVYPETVQELQNILQDPTIKQVKVQGTGHTFNNMSDTMPGGILVNLRKFSKIVVEGDVVTFGAGVTYSQLIEVVHKASKALANLPSLPHINVVGSMVTCTHGSGYYQKTLVNHVTKVEIVFADGSQRVISKEKDNDFYYYIINFGAVGIITSMTMKVVPQFKVLKSIYRDFQWDVYKDDKIFDEIHKGSDYVSFFCDWESRSMTTVWLGKKYLPGDIIPQMNTTFYGSPLIKEKRIHPVKGRDSAPCVTVGKGWWKEKIYHFLPDQPPSSDGDEIQTEFFISYSDFKAAMETLYQIRDKFKHLVQVTEIRMCLGDNIPLSPINGQSMVGIHWTWKKQYNEILAVLPHIEKALEMYNAKPHYGKLFLLSYQRLDELLGQDLQNLRQIILKNDPKGKFSNAFIKKYLFNQPSPKL